MSLIPPTEGVLRLEAQEHYCRQLITALGNAGLEFAEFAEVGLTTTETSYEPVVHAILTMGETERLLALMLDTTPDAVRAFVALGGAA